MNQDMKYGYLDETYETICPLGEQDIFLAKNRDNGRIFVKKYVAASVIPVYEKLIAIPAGLSPALLILYPLERRPIERLSLFSVRSSCRLATTADILRLIFIFIPSRIRYV